MANAPVRIALSMEMFGVGLIAQSDVASSVEIR